MSATPGKCHQYIIEYYVQGTCFYHLFVPVTSSILQEVCKLHLKKNEVYNYNVQIEI